MCLGPAGAMSQAPSQSQLLEDGLRLLETRGDARGALARFEQAAKGPDRAVQARARLYAGIAYERLHDDRARIEYERVLREFADQEAVVAEARRRLSALNARISARPLSLTLRPALPKLPQGLASLGTLASNGRRFAFVGDDGHVGLADSATGAHAVGVNESLASTPVGPTAASPDGTQVAVIREARDGTTTVSIEGQGSPVVLLRADAGATVSNVDWPLRGTVVCQIEAADGKAAAVLVDVSSRKVRASIPVSYPFTSRIALSPNSRWLAFDGPSSSVAGGNDIMLADVSTGRATTLIVDATHPAWTRDGRHLLFLSRRTGTTGLWAQAMVAGHTAGVATLIEQDLGRVFAVLGVTVDAYFYLRQVGLVDVFTVPLDPDGKPAGTARGAAATFVGSNMGPSFSPDGRTLAFLAQMGFDTREAIGLRDVDSGAYRTLVTDMRSLRLPRWSPDGRRLLVKGIDSTGRYGFHVVDAQTGHSTSLLTVSPHDESSLGVARWSADGRAIIYSGSRGTSVVFVRRDITSGEEQVLTEVPEASLRSRSFDLTGDGSIILIEHRGTGGAVIAHHSDGTTEDVLRFTNKEPVVSVSVWPDGHRLLIERPSSAAPTGEHPAFGLWVLRDWGGTPESLGVEMPGLRAASVSPDGTRLAFTAGWPAREPWVLEHFQSRLPSAHAQRGAAR
jgi:WD40 repeat protein